MLVSFADGSCELHKQTLTLCSSTNQSQPTSNLSEYLVFEKIFCREGYASILQGHLTYLAPELMRTLIRNGSTLSPRERNTEGTNVYAFRWGCYSVSWFFFGREGWGGGAVLTIKQIDGSDLKERRVGFFKKSYYSPTRLFISWKLLRLLSCLFTRLASLGSAIQF